MYSSPLISHTDKGNKMEKRQRRGRRRDTRSGDKRDTCPVLNAEITTRWTASSPLPPPLSDSSNLDQIIGRQIHKYQFGSAVTLIPSSDSSLSSPAPRLSGSPAHRLSGRPDATWWVIEWSWLDNRILRTMLIESTGWMTQPPPEALGSAISWSIRLRPFDCCAKVNN